MIGIPDVYKRQVHVIGDSFQPFVVSFFAGHLDRQMGKPAVRRRAVPVLHAGRNNDHVAWIERTGWLSPFLIPALAINTQQELSAAAERMMEMCIRDS